MQIKRGDIWYVERGYTTGSEQRPGRPGVIVSNDQNNRNSPTVELVYLTTQPKHDLPTHVTIRSTGQVSTAICEQITTVAVERIGDYCGHASDEEMLAVETAMMISLGCQFTQRQPEDDIAAALDTNEVEAPTPIFDAQLAEAEAKYRVLQEMYNSLLDRLVKAS